MDAWSAQPAAGTALPLEEYPERVLRRFLFDQESVAAEIGVRPVPLNRSTAERIEAAVARERANRNDPPAS